jgi:hypothetical protein
LIILMEIDPNGQWQEIGVYPFENHDYTEEAMWQTIPEKMRILDSNITHLDWNLKYDKRYCQMLCLTV